MEPVSGQYGHVILGRLANLPRLGRLPAIDAPQWVWSALEVQSYQLTLGAVLQDFGSIYTRRHSRALLVRRQVQRVELQLHDRTNGTVADIQPGAILPGDEVHLLLRRGRYPQYHIILHTTVETARLSHRPDRVRTWTLETTHGVLATADVPASAASDAPHAAASLLPPAAVAALAADILREVGYTPPPAGTIDPGLQLIGPAGGWTAGGQAPAGGTPWLVPGRRVGVSIYGASCGGADTFRTEVSTGSPTTWPYLCPGGNLSVTIAASPRYPGWVRLTLASGPQQIDADYPPASRTLAASIQSNCCGGAIIQVTLYDLG